MKTIRICMHTPHSGYNFFLVKGFLPFASQRTLTMFVGVVTLHFQHHAMWCHVCDIENGFPQLPYTSSESIDRLFLCLTKILNITNILGYPPISSTEKKLYIFD